MNELTPETAIRLRGMIENLNELLTQPQRRAMLETASESTEEAAGGSDDTLAAVHAIAERIQATFSTVLAEAPPSVRERIQQVANRRLKRAKLAASVPKRNWYQDYVRRTDLQFPRNPMNTLRAIHAWPNPFLDVKPGIPPAMRGPAKAAELLVTRKRANDLGL